jgi:predicted nucleotidyltransferase
MNPRDPNVQQLQLVAQALGHLRERLVFVGGCATGILITDDARPPVRATQDVDLIAEITTRAKLYELGSELRNLGFQEDQTADVICRWRPGNLKVDIMPSSDEVMNFSNRWYTDAIRESVSVVLPDSTSIRLITAPYFIATKLEAFHDRGKGDYLSHDMEDILNVIDGRPEITREISEQQGEIAAYLKTEFDELISDNLFIETLPSHFLPGPLDQQRVPILFGRLREIAGL